MKSYLLYVILIGTVSDRFFHYYKGFHSDRKMFFCVWENIPLRINENGGNRIRCKYLDVSR